MSGYDYEKRHRAALDHTAKAYAAERVRELLDAGADLSAEEVYQLLVDDARAARAEVERWEALRGS